MVSHLRWFLEFKSAIDVTREGVLACRDSWPQRMRFLPGSGCDTSHKFTGKERDSESGLDNLGARYYSVLDAGRSMSPDPANAGANPANPQSWNLYSYVTNNPLSLVDPSGLSACDPSDEDDTNCSSVPADQCGGLQCSIAGALPSGQCGVGCLIGGVLSWLGSGWSGGSGSADDSDSAAFWGSSGFGDSRSGSGGGGASSSPQTRGPKGSPNSTLNAPLSSTLDLGPIGHGNVTDNINIYFSLGSLPSGLVSPGRYGGGPLGTGSTLHVVNFYVGPNPAGQLSDISQAHLDQGNPSILPVGWISHLDYFLNHHAGACP